MTKRTDNIYLSLSGDRYTPFSLAKKLGAKAVLESASFSQGKDRYSILMLEEAFRVIQDEEGVAFVVEGKRQPFHLKEKADILDALLEIAEKTSFHHKIFRYQPQELVISVMSFALVAIPFIWLLK